MPSEPGRRLVTDIGGGSTEIIIGEGAHTKQLDSLYMGCVTMSAQYFPDGEITEKRMRRARLAARIELEPLQASSKRLGWEHAIGTSGTIRTVSDIVRARQGGEGLLTAQAVEELVEFSIRAGSTSKIKLEGLSEERTPIFPGGLAILSEVMSMLDIKALRVADGALREGLLYDLLGRLTDEDARMRSVRAMQARYHVELTQAERVEATALKFLAAVQQEWKLEELLAELVLRWASRLHEIGLDVSHSHYHRHSAYLLENADMPGFPQEEQHLLARVVGAHRRKLHLAALEDLTPPWHIKAEYLIVLFRLAVVLHRGRSSAPLPGIALTAKGRALDLEFPKHWLEEHPLTQADLEQEIEHLKPIGIKLRVA
jgi:exopolyphosphatase/guanosine-5'-triphosphate,3'-diphosphate pyrophosphatase